MTTRKLRDFIYENYCKRFGVTKKKSYYSLKKKKKKNLEKTRFTIICNQINNKSIQS